MATAAHPRCATTGPTSGPARATALPALAPATVHALSLAVLESALERLSLARRCLQRGRDPAHHLRIASLQIREATTCLAAPAEAAIAANLCDLADYMCRELGTAATGPGLTALANVCDLLRELRCAYLVPAVWHAAEGAGAAARP
jgi:flagellin-specific chaperone FliS